MTTYVKEGGQEMRESYKHKTDIEEIREWNRTRQTEHKKLEPVHDINKKKRPLTA